MIINCNISLLNRCYTAENAERPYLVRLLLLLKQYFICYFWPMMFYTIICIIAGFITEIIYSILYVSNAWKTYDIKKDNKFTDAMCEMLLYAFFKKPRNILNDKDYSRFLLLEEIVAIVDKHDVFNKHMAEYLLSKENKDKDANLFEVKVEFLKYLYVNRIIENAVGNLFVLSRKIISELNIPMVSYLINSFVQKYDFCLYDKVVLDGRGLKIYRAITSEKIEERFGIFQFSEEQIKNMEKGVADNVEFCKSNLMLLLDNPHHKLLKPITNILSDHEYNEGYKTLFNDISLDKFYSLRIFKGMNIGQETYISNMLEALNNIYDKQFGFYNPIKKFLLSRVTRKDKVRNLKVNKLHKSYLEYSRSYLFLNIILCDNVIYHILEESGAPLIIPIIWFCVFELGMIINSFRDFETTALQVSSVFNSNIEYRDDNVFVHLKRNIAGFYKFIFVCICAFVWLVFSCYSYVRYFSGAFNSFMSFLFYWISFVVFAFVMFLQMNVVDFSKEEFLIDYSDKINAFMTYSENVKNLYYSKFNASKYNFMGLFVFLCYIVLLFFYCLFVDNSMCVYNKRYNKQYLSKDSWAITGFDDMGFLIHLLHTKGYKYVINSKNIGDIIADYIQKNMLNLSNKCDLEEHKKYTNYLIELNFWSFFMRELFMPYLFPPLFLFLLSVQFYYVFDRLDHCVNRFDDWVFILLSQEDVKNTKVIDDFKSIGIKMKNFVLFNINYDFHESDKRLFIMKFKDAMLSGDNNKMHELLNECPYDDIKNDLTQKLNDANNVLLRDIDFVIDGNVLKVVKNKYKYIINDSRVIRFEGISGSGKTTILDMLSGKRKYICAFIDDNLSYNIDPKCQTLYPIYSSSRTNFFKHATLLDNFKNANSNFNGSSTIFNDLDIGQYSLSMELNFKDLRFSMGQKCRMDLAFLFSQIDNNIHKGRREFIVFMDEPFGPLDEANSSRVCNILEQYIDKHDLISVVVDHSNFISKIARLSMVIDNKTLKFVVADGREIQNLDFDENGIANVSGMRIERIEI